jgi:hypothetical protein
VVLVPNGFSVRSAPTSSTSKVLCVGTGFFVLFFIVSTEESFMHDVAGGSKALVSRLEQPLDNLGLISPIDSASGFENFMPGAMSIEHAKSLKGLSSHHDKPGVTSVGDPGPEESFVPECGSVKENGPIVQPVTPDAVTKASDVNGVVDSVVIPTTGLQEQTEHSLIPPFYSTKTSEWTAVKRDLKDPTNQGKSRPGRGRIVSLDRGRITAGVPALHSAPLTDDERHRRPHERISSHARRHEIDSDDDCDSSDDESSYFATHLPDPKSGRSYSCSSDGSAVARANSFYQGSVKQESDASLSFSDESDEDVHQAMGVRISPMIPTKGSVADMHLYPRRITRMHSVSSLVSSGSSEDGKPRDGRRSSLGSMSSRTSTGTTSEPSVLAEFSNMAIPGDAGAMGYTTDGPSGRRSPILGQQANDNLYFGSPSPGMPKLSPPTIMQEYRPPPGMPHPQPQPMSSDQISVWSSAGNAASQLLQQAKQPLSYGSTLTGPHEGHHGGFRSIVQQQGGIVPFAYSEDDDTEAFLIQRLATDSAASSSVKPTHSNSFADNRNNIIRSSDNENFGGTVGEQDLIFGRVGVQSNGGGDAGGADAPNEVAEYVEKNFKVYWQRWLMLFYMSALNLLSDWTCYSVAPIAILTKEAFGAIDPEQLVVIFLVANAIATACEPIILARLGLRRTVLFGALLLMFGSIIKSGGVPPIIQAELHEGHDEWRLYVGFFLVGLSQPLYQCTPALLSASWFPEKERTMATGVALNANQLGIGFAFIFGTLLVSVKEDIAPYFGLLSLISTIAFMGTLIQFDDAPPTPPSETARVMRGTLEVTLPSMNKILQSVQAGVRNVVADRGPFDSSAVAPAPSPAASHSVGDKVASQSTGALSSCKKARSKRSSKSSTSKKGGSARRRTPASRSTSDAILAPSPALSGPIRSAVNEFARIQAEATRIGVIAPSPMMPGSVGATDNFSDQEGEEEVCRVYDDVGYHHIYSGLDDPAHQGVQGLPPGQSNVGMPPGAFPPAAFPPGVLPPGAMHGAPSHGSMLHPQFQYPYWDPRVQQHFQQPPGYQQQQFQQAQAYHQHQFQQQQAYQQQYYYYQQQNPFPPQPYYYAMPYPPHLMNYAPPQHALPAIGGIDEGAEPIVTFTPHHLDINIRDDQVILSLRACLARPGFIHTLVSFTASGIVINTLSTYMDYLVRLNGGPRTYTGIVGGTFQFGIMIASLIVGSQTDKTRAYYSVTVGMLVLGAFSLAECGVSLDADRGGDMRWSLIIVALLVGPLQPVSTEMGVEVAYPLSENTVLVIQQLFSNLLSALFIPLFKSLKDVGTKAAEDSGMLDHPQYTFSFYLLIVIHAAATVFFATFNGRYLRYEHELQRKADEERRAMAANSTYDSFNDESVGEGDEYTNLM